MRQAGLEGASLLTEQEQEEARLRLGQRRGWGQLLWGMNADHVAEPPVCGK